VKEEFILKKLDLTVQKGEFVCIIGPIGSGKSSLLSTIIGDMIYSKESRVNQDDPTASEFVTQPINLNQELSYSQQIPWIQNKSIRENILFGLPYDQAKYEDTIKICELTRDLEILPNLDETEIGEKGINLSGGQKARVSLARAIYADRDLVLLDDPISALDANVKKKIFENVLLNHLKEKTIILVTHAIDFLHLVDRIVVLKEGEIAL
jgi:ABC-type bacteriocin/lantibiotic exporter with double-glycine peptidase domain